VAQPAKLWREPHGFENLIGVMIDSPMRRRVVRTDANLVSILLPAELASADGI
jgi:hypothetical protein